MNLKLKGSVQLMYYAADAADLDKHLNSTYSKTLIEYPKFYKMNQLCKLAWLAAIELSKTKLLEPWLRNDRLGTVLFNRSSSLVSDALHSYSIEPNEGQGASPSVFVYTLPNIVNGELAIYLGLHGYSNFYISDLQDPGQMLQQVRLGFQAGYYDAVLSGIIEVADGTGSNYASLGLIGLEEGSQQDDQEIIKRLFLKLK